MSLRLQDSSILMVTGYIRAGMLAATVIAALPACVTAPPTPSPVLESDSRGLLRRLVRADEILRRDPGRTDQHFHRARTLDALGLTRNAAEAYRKYLKEDRSYRWSAQARRRLRALPQEIPWTDWKKVGLPALRRAALAGDQDEVVRIVRRFPEDARTWGEKDGLFEWAYGFETGRRRYAAEQLTIARATGAALITVNDEWLLADAVAAIDKAGPERIAAIARGHSAYISGRTWDDSFALAAAAFAEGRSPMELAARNQQGELPLPAIPARYRSLVADAQAREARKLIARGDFGGAHELFVHASASYRRMAERHNEWYVLLSDTYLLEHFGEPMERWCRLFPTAAATNRPSSISWAVREAASAALRDREWGIARSLLVLISETDPYSREELLLLQATAAWNDGDADAARRYLRDARVLASVSSYGHAWVVDVAEAEMLRSADRDRSVQLLVSGLRQAITDWYQPGPVLPSRIATRIRYSYFDQNDIYPDFVGILHDWDSVAEAFAMSEQARARLLLLWRGVGDEGIVSAEAVRQSLAAGATLVSFVPLEERLIVFTIDRNGIASTSRNIGRARLERLVAENDPAKLRGALFGSTDFSAVRKLVVIPDVILARVPFGALLADTTDVVVAPSATMYVRLASTEDVPRKSAVVVGDPAFDREELPSLERLPAAAAEAREVAAMYRSRLLLGNAATPAALLANAGDHDVIHVAAHAETADRHAAIVMTSSLSLHDVALSSVRRGSVAVLAGCRTGARTSAASSDVSSLAFAFLAAGSRSAVATLWDVDDQTTRLFSRRLHQLLVTGMPVGTAVRRVQLELRDRGLPVRTWGAFQVYGAG